MAKEVAPNQITREAGDVCPRQCAGVLGEPVHKERWKGYLDCDVCNRHFVVRYNIPASKEEREGVKTPLFLPDDIILAMIEASHTRDLAAALPNPEDRKDVNPDWFKESDLKNQQQWIEDTRAKLEPVWPMIAEWFGAAPDQAAVRRNRNAVMALQEIAIPSLKHCEEKYGYDDQARINLEAAIKE